MGIKHLNQFLRENCKDSIKFISLAELSGKKIAVDISIYLYKFIGDDNLIENIYLMLSVFRHYSITPIFVFDGKPPAEKKELLAQRREEKALAKNEYNSLKKKLENDNDIDEQEKHELINNMDILKKKFIYISKETIENIKNLIRLYGATYCDAPGEADELCSFLVIKNKVWATLSEDMDMFVYGTHRVIRYLSLLNHTAVLYDQKSILENLGISQKEFREICTLSSNDYNTNNEKEITLYNSLKIFKKYYKNKNDIDFYDWLVENTNHVNDLELLNHVYSMFDLPNSKNIDLLKHFEQLKISNGPIYFNEMREILKEDGFIYPSTFRKGGVKI